MKKGKCIYCKKNKDLNKEHAFPKFLLQVQEGAPEWIIDNHLCEPCNQELCKLDMILKMRGPIGHTWSQIRSESGQETKDQQSARYHQKIYGLPPDRMLMPDPVLEKRIGLFKLLVEKTEENIPLNSIENSLEPVVPQIILTAYAGWQKIEEVRAKDAEGFAELGLIPLSHPSVQESIYWIGNDSFSMMLRNLSEGSIHAVKNHIVLPPTAIFSSKATADFPFPHTYIFPPKATDYFLDKPRDFENVFLHLKKFACFQYDLMIIREKKNKKHGKVKHFAKSIKADQKVAVGVVEKEIYLKNETFANISRTDTLQGRFVIDSRAEAYIERSIAKIAFHSLLYHYPKFSGHEPAFDDIKEFIYKEGIANNFVTYHRNIDFKSGVYPSNTHFHNISFFVRGGNIGCYLDLLTGLSRQLFSFGVTLAGKIENWKVKFDRTERIPFYVNPKSNMKKRIHCAESSGLIHKPKSSDLGLIHDLSLKDIFHFGQKGN